MIIPDDKNITAFGEPNPYIKAVNKLNEEEYKRSIELTKKEMKAMLSVEPSKRPAELLLMRESANRAARERRAKRKISNASKAKNRRR